MSHPTSLSELFLHIKHYYTEVYQSYIAWFTQALDREYLKTRCSICTGTIKLLDGKPCGCKDGTIFGELRFLREQLMLDNKK